MSEQTPVPEDPSGEHDLTDGDEFAKMQAVMRASEKHREGGIDRDLDAPGTDPGPGS